MASYIIKINKAVHSTSDQCNTAITNAGASITTNYKMLGSYKVEGTQEQVAAINGLKSSQLEADEVTSNLSIATANNTFLKQHGIDASGAPAWSPQSTGTNAKIYLLDTGINASHNEFGSSTITNLYNTSIATGFADTNGHGTAMASLIVGDNIGSSPDATLFNVKMFNEGAGNISVGEVVSALDSVAVHHAANDASDPKVVCMPFTMTKSQLIDDTLNDMLDDGLIVIAAAGNDGGEVDNFTPGGLDTVITVGAIDNSYKVMDITNRPIVDTSANIDLERSVNTNAKLDIFAIGKDVMIADSSNVANYVWQDGTSVSTAITSGICAQYIDIYSSQSANQIKSTLVTEGHIYARQTSNSSDSTTTLLKYTDLTFDSGKSLDSGNVSFSLAYAPQSTDVSFASHPSGRLFDIEYGSSANVNINISGSASNVAVIDFSPLSPWMTFNTGTGIVTADTSNSTLAPNSIAPGIYNFAVKGTVGSKTIVEEYSIGVYANGGNANDLNVADEYYYDDEANDYEAVISYAVAPTGPQKP
jgi:hypothetical protein